MQHINPQELKYTKTKRKASNVCSKHLTHDDIPLLKLESRSRFIERGSTSVYVFLKMTQCSGTLSSRKNRDHSDVVESRLVNDWIFLRDRPESPGKWRSKPCLSPKKWLRCDHLLVLMLTHGHPLQ